MTDKYKQGLKELAKEHSLYPQEQLATISKSPQSLTIGIPKEVSRQEHRVSLTPQAVGVLTSHGHEVLVESNAGRTSKFFDNEYSDAGARIVYSAKDVYESDIVLKVEPPTMEELEMFKPGKTLISALQIGDQKKEYIEALQKKKITAIAYEYIEDKVGGMPVVRAMSEIAGNSCMLIAAEYMSSIIDGKGLILGGITGVPPTKVVILGAGTVGEYAARAALGLGACVEVYDDHIYKLRRIRHILGQQVFTSTVDPITVGNTLETADVVIGAIRAEKGRAKVIVTEEMVANMQPESIIIDVSIDQGGCIETSEVTNHNKPIFRKYEVIHYCVPNIASRVARTATMAFSHIFLPMLINMSDAGGVEDHIFSDKGFMAGVYVYKGSLTNEHIGRKFDLKSKNLDLLRAARF